MAQEPEGSSPHSQKPTTGPCPELVNTIEYASARNIMTSVDESLLGYSAV
jgi:hypothetical protein